MKKLFVSFACVLAAIFASCDNENTVNPPTAETGIATFRGTVYANLNENVAALEKAPNGTKLIIQIATNVNNVFEYQEVTVGAEGRYEFTVEVGSRVRTLTIIPAQFEATVTNTGCNPQTRTAVFSANPINGVGVIKGNVRYTDITYTTTPC